MVEVEATITTISMKSNSHEYLCIWSDLSIVGSILIKMTALYLHEDAKELLADKTLVVLGDSGKFLWTDMQLAQSYPRFKVKQMTCNSLLLLFYKLTVYSIYHQTKFGKYNNRCFLSRKTMLPAKFGEHIPYRPCRKSSLLPKILFAKNFIRWNIL